MKQFHTEDPSGASFESKNNSYLSTSPHIGIIGAGAAGLAAFRQIVENSVQKNYRPKIFLIEKRTIVGPGLAYGESSASQILNRNAHTMSICPKDPSEFVNFLISKNKDVHSSEFFPERKLFGEYLISVYKKTCLLAKRQNIEVYHVHDEVVDLTRGQNNTHFNQYDLHLRQKKILTVDYVLFCMGNVLSNKFKSFKDNPFLISNPYPVSEMIELVGSEKSIAIVGTGLVAVDAALALLKNNTRAKVTMFSRNGFLPAVKRGSEPYVLKYLRRDIFEAMFKYKISVSLSDLLSFLKFEIEDGVGRAFSLKELEPISEAISHFEKYSSANNSYELRKIQSIFAATNESIDEIWERLDDPGKIRVLKKHYALLMAIRVGIPEKIAKILLEEFKLERLRINSGYKGLSVKACGAIKVIYKKDGVENVESFGRVVNCTGYARKLEDCDSIFISNLLRRFPHMKNSYGGMKVDHRTNQVILENVPEDRMFAIGSLTQGVFLMTNVLELNVKHAARVARKIDEHICGYYGQPQRSTNSTPLVQVQVCHA